MMTIFPDPKDTKYIDQVCVLILWVIAFLVLLFTLPGCQQQEKQPYQPFIPHSTETKDEQRAIDKIRPPVHEAAERVDKILEKTPVPAVATPLADDVLDGIEKIDPLPPPAAPDPKVAEIIEPELEPVVSIEAPDTTEPIADDESGLSIAALAVVCIGLLSLVYVAFKMLKGSNQDDEDLKRKTTTS